MKTIFYFTFAISFITNTINSQDFNKIKDKDIEGIYLTYSDYASANLIRPIDKQHKKDKIKLRQFLVSKEILTVEQDKITLFPKDSIFAVRLQNGKSYRFINNNPSIIIDTSCFYIYKYITSQTVYKRSGPRRRYAEKPIVNYYFSYGDHSSICRLTLENIRKYLPAESSVYNTICNQFTSNEMLEKINSETGRFELNETILLFINNQ